MPKRYGVKDKDVAVAHIVSGLLEGRLRTGDRIDRTEIAANLGMSRVPVQEAVNQLERDGIVTIPYHRGVFLERFDAGVVREHYEIYGALCAIASARAASTRPAPLLSRLRELSAEMAAAIDAEEFESRSWEFRRAINSEVAGPRLRAAIGSFAGFMPTAFLVASIDRGRHLRPSYSDELGAIEAGDAERAGRVVVLRSERMAETIIDELCRRGVLGSGQAAERVAATATATATVPTEVADQTGTGRSS